MDRHIVLTIEFERHGGDQVMYSDYDNDDDKLVGSAMTRAHVCTCTRECVCYRVCVCLAELFFSSAVYLYVRT